MCYFEIRNLSAMENDSASQAVTPQTQGEFTPPAPTFVPGRRVNRWIASLVDSFLLGLAATPLIILSEIATGGKISFDSASLDDLQKNVWVNIAVLLLVGWYKIWLLFKNEATPGKNWRKLKVLRNKDLRRITFLNAAAREISQVMYAVPILGALLYFISVILVLFTKKRRALHDFVGGTIVIQQ